MKANTYKWILYLIAATILTTIAVQFYWNFRNYKENKQRVLNEIQISLDKAVNDYYTNLSKKNFLTIVESDTPVGFNINSKKKWGKLLESDTLKKKNLSLSDKNHSKYSKFIDSLVKNVENDLRSELHDSLTDITGFTQLSKTSMGVHVDATKNSISSVQVFRGKKATDSLKLIQGLKTIFIAIQNDTLVYTDLDSLLTNELKEKRIDIKFAFKHYKNDTLFHNYNTSDTNHKYAIIDSESTFFKDNEGLKLVHSDPSNEALKRSSTGILVSLVLSLAVISSLFYLLKIINQQKALAEIKNDLISNITHEFKTPIATISTAVEAIENFNVSNDKEKTEKYLNISSLQLKKLHGMVEKLLETATLDSEDLFLRKEPQNLVALIEKLVNKHRLLAAHRTLNFSTNITELFIKIDPFHFENAVSNLIDNAVKYGGNAIEINITSLLDTVEISVADNGSGIDKSQLDKIFDKFYRIPKGNVHDIKGFGIGLYYSKKIVEKHQGSLRVSSKLNSTIFKILVPND